MRKKTEEDKAVIYAGTCQALRKVTYHCLYKIEVRLDLDIVHVVSNTQCASPQAKTYCVRLRIRSA